MGNGDAPTEGAGAPKKAVNIAGIQFDPAGESLLVLRVRASLMPNKTAEEIERSGAAPAIGGNPSPVAGGPGSFEGGGTSGDAVVFGGGGTSGDAVVFGGGGEFMISIPVSLLKA